MNGFETFKGLGSNNLECYNMLAKDKRSSLLGPFVIYETMKSCEYCHCTILYTQVTYMAWNPY